MSMTAPVYSFDAIEQPDRGDALRCRCTIAAALPCFDGHFPGLPLMPAAAQLAMLQALLLRHSNWQQTIIGGSRLKFSAPIRPGDRLDIELQRKPSGDIEFSITTADSPASRGSLKLGGCPRTD